MDKKQRVYKVNHLVYAVFMAEDAFRNCNEQPHDKKLAALYALAAFIEKKVGNGCNQAMLQNRIDYWCYGDFMATLPKVYKSMMKAARIPIRR